MNCNWRVNKTIK